MQEVIVEIRGPGQIEPDVLALAVPEDGSGTVGVATGIDDRLADRLRRLASDGDLRGELGRSVLLPTDGDDGVRRLVAAGVGRREDVDADALRTAASSVVQA